ncbi:hypothetical protein [Bradyrhizobium sp. McL0615]|uniref:hypothetical protein n=1 Tax=Bradyrhizobium sp. McL0615 TaxID=3415673 RepID=UPI003CE69853
MPLMKYVFFVGSALVLLLLAMNWLLPDPTAEPIYTSTVRPVIKISSIETLPEKVVLDNTLPYTAPPPDVMRVATRPLPSALTFEKITPGLLPEFSTLAQVPPKTITEERDAAKIKAKRHPAKKVVANRVAPKVHVAAVKNLLAGEFKQDTKPADKTTFLDDIAGRLGQMFKVN